MKIKIIIVGEPKEITQLIKEIYDKFECDTVIIQASPQQSNEVHPPVEAVREPKLFTPEQVRCETCGSLFSPKTYKSRFCSNKCAAISYQRKCEQDKKLKKIKEEIPIIQRPEIKREL